jgi:hypothetical protein
MWGRSAAVAAAVAVVACAVAAPGRAAAVGVPAAGDAGATDSAVPVAASFIAEGPDLFPVVCVMFSWPGHPQDRVGCVAHLGYVAQVLRTGHVDLCTPNQPMCRVEFNERPTTARYGPGKVVDVGPYRCEVLKVAVRCLVRSTGSGFRINNHEAVRVAAGPPKKSAPPGATGAIYFLPGFLNAVNAGSERAVEPPLLALFADGSWVLEGLKWTGWGTPVAHATGISSASNGIPNQAEGTRIKTPAEAMLSNPGPFFGHRIYRCIQVFVQPPANFGGKRCLKRTGSLYLYE